MKNAVKGEGGAVITRILPLRGREYISLFNIRFRSGVEVHSCVLKYTDDKRHLTVLPPRIPMLDGNGELIFDGAGRLVYEIAMSFATK